MIFSLLSALMVANLAVAQVKMCPVRVYSSSAPAITSSTAAGYSSSAPPPTPSTSVAASLASSSSTVPPPPPSTSSASPTPTPPPPPPPKPVSAVPASLIFKNVDQAKVDGLDQITVDRANNSWMYACKSNYAFCCWNTDAGGNSNQCGLPADGKTHCHGVVIPARRDTPSFFHAQLALNYVQIHDHLQKRNYYRRIPGTQSCDCGENMAMFQRSDASKIVANPAALVNVAGENVPDPSVAGNFQAAGGNDLATAFKEVFGAVPDDNLSCSAKAGGKGGKKRRSLAL